MKNKIALLTSSFPFEGGEQFLESEIPYWENNKGKLIIFPMETFGSQRNYPKGIIVDRSLSKKKSHLSKLKNLFLGCFSKYFWIEVLYLKQKRKLNLARFLRALKETASSISLAKILEVRLNELGVGKVYCYWNNTQANASIMVKDRNKHISVYSRCHRYDLYEERHALDYIPFKRQFANKYAQWFVICESAKDYLISKYKVREGNISLARLGVEVQPYTSEVSGINCLNIVSVSYCVQVKQIDKIIRAIADFHELSPSVKVKWSHIGDGPLLEPLRKLADDMFNGKRIEYCFLGKLCNRKVKDFYLQNEVDIFINSSASEGVPVSIMEAMEAGVPVIAPNVGGISELLEVDSCVLLPEVISPESISNAIMVMLDKCKSTDVRERCKNKITKEYNAKVNFTNFVHHF